MLPLTKQKHYNNLKNKNFSHLKKYGQNWTKNKNKIGHLSIKLITNAYTLFLDILNDLFCI